MTYHLVPHLLYHRQQTVQVLHLRATTYQDHQRRTHPTPIALAVLVSRLLIATMYHDHSNRSHHQAQRQVLQMTALSVVQIDRVLQRLITTYHDHVFHRILNIIKQFKRYRQHHHHRHYHRKIYKIQIHNKFTMCLLIKNYHWS